MAITARVKLTPEMLDKLEKGETITFRIPEGIREVQIVRYEPSVYEVFQSVFGSDIFADVFPNIFREKK